MSTLHDEHVQGFGLLRIEGFLGRMAVQDNILDRIVLGI